MVTAAGVQCLGRCRNLILMESRTGDGGPLTVEKQELCKWPLSQELVGWSRTILQQLIIAFMCPKDELMEPWTSPVCASG